MGRGCQNGHSPHLIWYVFDLTASSREMPEIR